jgi:uncharacterized membrane protein required for colicin V production
VLEKLAVNVVAGVLALALVLALGAATGFVFALCWNAVAAPVFGLPTLEWWQAWLGLVVLGLLGRALKG